MAEREATMIDVSFIVPVFNKARYLDECLRSLEAQTCDNIEIVCVDNNSTDASPDIIRAHREKDDRIVSLLETKQGVSHARNAGLAAARGTYVLFIDADDFVEPTLAESVLKVADEHRPDVIMYQYDLFYEATSTYTKNTQKELPSPVRAQDLGSTLFSYTTPSSCTKAFRREFLEAHQTHFNTSIRFGEDLLFSFSNLMLADVLYQIPGAALYHYRKDVEGSATELRSNTDGSMEILTVLEELDGVRTRNDLPDSFELGILNQALCEVRYALKITRDINQFDAFYQAFLERWHERILAYPRDAYWSEELYDLYAVPSNTLELLAGMKRKLEADKSALSKKNREVTAERNKLKTALQKKEAELKNVRDSRTFKVGSAVLKPLRAVHRITKKRS